MITCQKSTLRANWFPLSWCKTLDTTVHIILIALTSSRAYWLACIRLATYSWSDNSLVLSRDSFHIAINKQESSRGCDGSIPGSAPRGCIDPRSLLPMSKPSMWRGNNDFCRSSNFVDTTIVKLQVFDPLWYNGAVTIKRQLLWE
jgi:hypothetical protein